MPRLLIVEDNPSLRQLYQDEFAEEGYEVSAVSSGEEALEQLHKSRPQAIVLDIRLTGMNGLEVLRRVLLEMPEVAVVLNSAYSSYKQDFTSWSADGYVVKSSDLSELKSAVVSAIQRRVSAA